MNPIRIMDTTLTDGLTSAGIYLMAEEKLAVTRKLHEVGVDLVEAGYPSRSAADFAAVQLVSQFVKEVTVAARARLLETEIDMACKALQPAQSPRIKITAPTSPAFVKYTLQMDERQVVEAVVRCISHARTLVSDVQFTAEDASRTDWGFLTGVCAAAATAGATTIVVQDSVGRLTPKEFYDLIRYLREHAPVLQQVHLGVDCRHDLGMALANALGAVERGIEQVETTVGGVGFPLGHVPLEAFVTALRSRHDRYPCQTGVQSDKLYQLSDLVQSLTGAEGVLWGRVLRDAAFTQADEVPAAPRSPAGGPFSLGAFRLVTNEVGECIAETTLVTPDGSERFGTASGSTQIETLHRAIAAAAAVNVRLVDHAVNHLRRDCKEALVYLEDDTRVVSGRGVSSTVLRASAEAYVDALQRLVGA